MSALFLCSRCFSRHPLKALSVGQQLCKDCRGAIPIVKCTYCRSIFQRTSEGCSIAICKKCDADIKQFGKPTVCKCCNIIAAFVGNKCRRCTKSENKYGPPTFCEQCKQKCAFDHKDEEKKIDGKVLCWLCTLSFKRALAKKKRTDAKRRAHMKIVAGRLTKGRDVKHRRHSKHPHRVDVTKLSQTTTGQDEVCRPPPPEAARAGSNNSGDAPDPKSSDHVLIKTQLKQQIASLQKQLSEKDDQLLSKDKMITGLMADHFIAEQELRTKMKCIKKDYDKKVQDMLMKVKTLQRKVATLSKSNNTKKMLLARELANGTGSGCGNDSPFLAE